LAIYSVILIAWAGSSPYSNKAFIDAKLASYGLSFFLFNAISNAFSAADPSESLAPDVSNEDFAKSAAMVASYSFLVISRAA
jgi:hypothetical protein